MAVTITGTPSNGHSTGAVSSYSFSHTSNGDDLYVFLGMYDNQLNLPSCTFNGVTMARVGKYAEASSGVAELHIFFLPAVAAVTANVVTAPQSGTRYFTNCALNLSGCGGVRAVATARAASTSSSVTVICVSGDLVFDSVHSDRPNNDWTVGGGQTQVYEQVDATSDEKSALSYLTSSGGTATLTETLSVSSTWTAFGIAMAPATGGGGGGGTGGSFTFVG